MHVSLTKELESLIKERVDTGMYYSASEVVREALRQYFSNDMAKEEVSHIRQVVSPRLQAVKDGTAELEDFDQAFDEAEAEAFG